MSPPLRVPRVVVLAGHLLAWVGSRQSIKPVPGCFVDATTCLQDKRDEVVLVGVLHHFDPGLGLRRQSRCGTTALVDIALGPGAHHADVEDPRVAVLADLDVAAPLARAAVLRLQHSRLYCS